MYHFIFGTEEELSQLISEIQEQSLLIKPESDFPPRDTETATRLTGYYCWLSETEIDRVNRYPLCIIVIGDFEVLTEEGDVFIPKEALRNFIPSSSLLSG